MAELRRMEAMIDNEQGAAPLLLVCDHASNYLPPHFSGLGLPSSLLEEHVAWDIGAHALSKRLARVLDAPLVAAPASRLIVDPNRALSADDLIPAMAENVPIPGNSALSAAERQARIDAFHAPFHDAIGACLSARSDIVALISVHSFTPVFLGDQRPWDVGILHGADARIADMLIGVLAKDASLIVGRNQPYAPENGVFYTLGRHGGARATAMIEVRNDLLRDEIGQERWTRRLAEALATALQALASTRDKPEAIGGRK